VVEQAVEAPDPAGWALTATPVVPTIIPGGAVADIPLWLSGQGLVEAARLALLLTEPAQALLLDEPATALSAVAQRRLLGRLVDRAGARQTIVITHSAHLVPVAAAATPVRNVRLTRDAAGVTVVHHVRDDLAGIGKHGRLLGDADIRDALFAAAVWLVEGATDEEALRIWLADLGGSVPTPESTHVLIVAVEGGENFSRYAELMAELGIPYGILADRPALRVGGPLRRLHGTLDFGAVPDSSRTAGPPGLGQVSARSLTTTRMSEASAARLRGSSRGSTRRSGPGSPARTAATA
jgi:hypothetical protein